MPRRKPPRPHLDICRSRSGGKSRGADQTTFRLVALDAELIVGEAELTLLPETGRLTIVVREDYRRRGIGSALLAGLIDKARLQRGTKRIALDVFADNEAALRLYQNFGFEIEARRIDGMGRALFSMARTSQKPA